jgi:excisionase family DNA binding protein
MEERSRLLRPREAAEMLAVSERTLWDLSNGGGLPCVRIGRAVRYDPADLAGWIARQKAGGVPNVSGDSDARPGA